MYLICCIYSIEIHVFTYVYHLNLYLRTVSTPCCTHAGWWFWKFFLFTEVKRSAKLPKTVKADGVMKQWFTGGIFWHISSRKLLCPQNIPKVWKMKVSYKFLLKWSLFGGGIMSDWKITPAKERKQGFGSRWCWICIHKKPRPWSYS